MWGTGARLLGQGLMIAGVSYFYYRHGITESVVNPAKRKAASNLYQR